MSSAEINERTLHHPRLICLHGGGVTAEIYGFQMRAVIRELANRFRLVFVDGPFFCEPGPGIMPVYEGMGPYRRWLRWLPSHAEIDAETAIGEIEYVIRSAMTADDNAGGDGPWVGLVGFSQGAKIAASILYDQQLRRSRGVSLGSAPQWLFGVIMAGRAPLVSMSEATADNPRLPKAGELAEDWDFDGPDIGEKLKTPTIHLHGLADPGLKLHRAMPTLFCADGSFTILEWDGDHRVPFKMHDIQPFINAINRVANEVGVDSPEV